MKIIPNHFDKKGMIIAFRNILIILERNVLIKEALMMVLAQVDMEFAAHVSF